jgi:SRSO17 transposase
MGLRLGDKELTGMIAIEADSIFAPRRWGLSAERIAGLGERLHQVWARFRPCFKSRTQDPSAHAWTYLNGLLKMDTKRNYANIARRVQSSRDDGQALQNFMSDSPWDAQGVFDQIQRELQAHVALRGGMLTLDETADERAGDQSAGAARQYLSRFGKLDLGQVGVALGYYKAGTWALVDATLFLPATWFAETHADLRQQLHIPPTTSFTTKANLGLQLIQHARQNGLAFDVVGCDAFYGRNSLFRASLDARHCVYLATVPCNTRVYVQEPIIGRQASSAGKVGRPAVHAQILNGMKPERVDRLSQQPDGSWHMLDLRPCERGVLSYECAARRIWTISADRQVRAEWLLLRREPDGSLSYALSNAPADTPLERLALWRSQRYFAERIFQDAKSEGGWAELVARKYRAWMHHAALDALALWFIAETKLEWATAQPRDPQLPSELQVQALPALSMANVRELLRAAMPLPTLSVDEATALVVTHLVKRAASTRSRLKSQRRQPRAKSKQRPPN